MANTTDFMTLTVPDIVMRCYIEFPLVLEGSFIPYNIFLVPFCPSVGLIVAHSKMLLRNK